jgi:hypothetical protein
MPQQPKRQQYIPPLLAAVFAFSLGTAVNVLDLAERSWRLVFPERSEISLHQKFLAFQPGYFGTDFDGALSHYPGEFVQNETFAQARLLQQNLEPPHGEMLYEQLKDDGSLNAKSFSDLSENNVLARLFFSARDNLQKSFGRVPDDITIDGGELICLELTLGDEAVASYISVTGITISTKGKLFPFQVDYLKRLHSIEYENNSLKGDDSLGLNYTLDASEVTIRTGDSQKFQAPGANTPIRISLMYTVSVSADNSSASNFTVGTAFLPQEITIHYADGREEPQDVRDLSDMWSVDFRFSGLKSGA